MNIPIPYWLVTTVVELVIAILILTLFLFLQDRIMLTWKRRGIWWVACALIDANKQNGKALEKLTKAIISWARVLREEDPEAYELVKKHWCVEHDTSDFTIEKAQAIAQAEEDAKELAAFREKRPNVPGVKDPRTCLPAGLPYDTIYLGDSSPVPSSMRKLSGLWCLWRLNTEGYPRWRLRNSLGIDCPHPDNNVAYAVSVGSPAYEEAINLKLIPAP